MCKSSSNLMGLYAGREWMAAAGTASQNGGIRAALNNKQSYSARPRTEQEDREAPHAAGW